MESAVRWRSLGSRLASKAGVAALTVAVCLACAIPLPAQPRTTLVGSGSSLAVPLMSAWGKEFAESYPNVQVAYVATSSGEGIRQISAMEGDFAVGEVPLTDKQKSATKSPLAQIPIAVVTIVPVYNLPVQNELRFTGDLLAQIYMGHISKWNDERIARINPGISLPDLKITLVQRPDGTGSRFIFTQFLIKTCPEFRRWETAGRKGAPPEVMEERSRGVAGRVASTPGAIGFVDWSVAEKSGLSSGRIRNFSGKFVKASLSAVVAASEAMEETVFMSSPEPPLDAPGENSYPLTSFVWVYLPVNVMASDHPQMLYDFLSWCLDPGQSLIAGSGYHRLPVNVAARARAKLKALGHSIPNPASQQAARN